MLLTSPIVKQLSPRNSALAQDRDVSRRIGIDVIPAIIRPPSTASEPIARGRAPGRGRRELPMRRGRGVTRQRFGVTHIDQSLEQLERIVKRFSRLESSGDAEGQNR